MPNLGVGLTLTNLHKPSGGGLVFVTTSSQFDPASGFEVVNTYEGDESGCTARQGLLSATNIRSRVYQVEGPVWRIDIRQGSPPATNGAEQPNDQWEFDKDYIQVDMRNHPNIIQLAGSADILNNWIAVSDELIRLHKTAADGDPDGDPLGFVEVLTLRSFGQKSFEVERIVLKRERTYSIQYLANEVLEAIPSIYTTAALKRVYKVPAVIATRLPPDPAFTPSVYHIWAWKQRQSKTNVIPKIGKVSETTDFVFAAWAKRVHNIVT